MGAVRLLYKVPTFVVSAALSYVVLGIMDILRLKAMKRPVKRGVYKLCLLICGIKVRAHGELRPGPSLLVSNHCSYLDVIMLGSCGEMCFTPKSDVKGWPFFGPLVSRYDVAYVDRKPGKTKAMQQVLQDTLHGGARICVFPEATTNDGRAMLPFKSSLFSLAEQWQGAEPLSVQPVTIVYHHVNGKPMDDESWPKVAWYGEIGIVPHLMQMMSLRSIEADVHFHPPIRMEEGEGRKMLSERSEAIVGSLFPHTKEESHATG